MTHHPDALTIPSALVEPRLRHLLLEYRATWTDLDPILAEITDRLESLILAGGKRVRPAMAYWGFVGAGGAADEPALADLCSALELLQGFALFHDDVMDGSQTRRGVPTAHEAEGQRHRDGEWNGEARRYGEAIAILAGDISLVLSDVLLSDVPSDVRRLWNDLRIEVNLGQFLDVVGTARGAIAIDSAERIVEYKTARYTIVRPLQMGAALAGRADLGAALSAIGTPLGIAFQLRDDLLGAFGETAVTGKPVGDDLSEGKPTPLLARAYSLANSQQAASLDLVGGDLTEGQIGLVQETLSATGAVAAIESRIEKLTKQSLAAIQTSGLGGDAPAQLSVLAHYLAGRSH